MAPFGSDNICYGLTLGAKYVKVCNCNISLFLLEIEDSFLSSYRIW